ncbi:RTA1 domain protein [Aspergillus terreus]|uniref:RTA1 domain protein n=1 Tax=Aspergillus terreus TaxID=33178 RepID=A0A5M3ZDJ4_ASPTE|nr:hypothetical protein ATETN484_0016023700 [Aspergillus terreus]GFF21660.1 RTA1 domain protein [Aspergillus terreus]
MAGQIVPGNLYIYIPNKGAPIFFTIAFAISAAGHIWQCLRYKSFKMIGLHPLCAVLFTAGYAMRAYNAHGHYMYNTPNLLVYILSQVFIYICPPLLELANYHILARILHYIPHLAPLRASNILPLFGGLMALVEALNALGVSFAANPTGSRQDLGRVLVLAALALQLCVVVVFVLVAGVFHWRCAEAAISRRSVPTLLATLYISMALILVRCVYRLVEHVGSTAVDIDDPESLRALSPLLTEEWFFYVFEGGIMLCNSVLWNVVNPGRLLPRQRGVRLEVDGITEVEDEDVGSDTPMVVRGVYAVVDVLSFGLFRFVRRGKR